MNVHEEAIDVTTPTGPMRTYVYHPVDSRPGADKRYPGLVLYSEIFQQTEPIRRLAVQFAGQGFVVMVPEVYHAFEPAGSVHTLECIEDDTQVWFQMYGVNLNLAADGSIESVFDGPGTLEAYYALCEAEGLPRPNVLVS